MEQREFPQNFFLSSMKKLNKELDEEMPLIDVKTHQIPDIKFDQFLFNEHWSYTMQEVDSEHTVM